MQEHYSLEYICGGPSAVHPSDKLLGLLTNFVLPLCIRVGCGCRGMSSYAAVCCFITERKFFRLCLRFFFIYIYVTFNDNVGLDEKRENLFLTFYFSDMPHLYPVDIKFVLNAVTSLLTPHPPAATMHNSSTKSHYVNTERSRSGSMSASEKMAQKLGHEFHHTAAFIGL